MSEFFFIRHGQASALSDNYDQLSDLGKVQSFKTGEYLGHKLKKCDKVYYGPLHRHHQTVDHFKKGWLTQREFIEAEFIMLDALEEHHGYKVVKSVLPDMIMENTEIQELASLPFSNRKEQLKNYFRIYEKMSLMWANEEFNGMAEKHESWNEFISRSQQGLHQIKEESNPGERIIIITSGGPISSSLASSLHLDYIKTLEISWNIHNCSITKFQFDQKRFSLSSFNSTHHFHDESLITLV